MNYISFDLFVSCYIYGSIGYISILFILHLYCALLAISDEQETVNQVDFYTQVKELLNPATEDIFDPLPSPLESGFSSMTIRELRHHVRDNGLQKQILSLTGKTVSNARKQELVTALS